MKSKDLLKILSQVTYKPGFKLRIDETMRGVRVTFEAIVPDRDSEKPVKVYNQCVLEPSFFERESQVLGFLRSAIHRMECHEADEWIRFSGVLAFDPHKDETP